MKRQLSVGLFALMLPVCAAAIDADGFFYAKPASGGFGEVGTSTNNGLLQAVYKMEEGILKVCLSRQMGSSECNGGWLSPSDAVAKLVKNSCYLGFQLEQDMPVFFYRVNRSCE